jgi:ATP-dependent RNA helicase DeaD
LYGKTGSAEGFTRVYVGQGRQHGLGARDIAALLMRAGGIPGRLVDEIEMKDYCSFATLPADAARRACTFSRKEQQGPVVRLARAPEFEK